MKQMLANDTVIVHFCRFWCNCWPSLFQISFHNLVQSESGMKDLVFSCTRSRDGGMKRKVRASIWKGHGSGCMVGIWNGKWGKWQILQIDWKVVGASCGRGRQSGVKLSKLTSHKRLFGANIPLDLMIIFGFHAKHSDLSIFLLFSSYTPVLRFSFINSV